MAHFLFRQQLDTLYFLILLLSIGWLNRLALRRLREYPAATDGPLVSVLIPARNEAHRILPCLRSLVGQTYPHLEILVLDDESEDDTAARVQAFRREHPEVRLIRGRPLPPGWMGKNWACHQLAQAARGQILLFTDADTVHAPETVSRAVGALQAGQAALLTGLPQQIMGSRAERLTLPFITWALRVVYPHFLVWRVRLPGMALGVGQFMAFRRAAYEQIGGHAAVRGEVVEDVALARRVRAGGGRVTFLELAPLVACRMYEDWRGVADGFTKNVFAVFNRVLWPYLFAWLWLWWAFCLPLLGVLAAGVGWPLPGFDLRLGLAGVGLSVLLWGWFGPDDRPALYWMVTYPLILTAFTWIALRSAWYTATGREVAWKGRVIGG